ncbi:MAG: hypothetical protein U9Q22_07975 [Candidatus Altiarchaeota archaeon]|nr:hypothetical protein [Candidatus Altiarchaeota archaeon]
MDLGGKNIMQKVYEMRVSRISEGVKEEVEKDIEADLKKYRLRWNMSILGEIIIFIYLLCISII